MLCGSCGTDENDDDDDEEEGREERLQLAVPLPLLPLHLNLFWVCSFCLSFYTTSPSAVCVHYLAPPATCCSICRLTFTHRQCDKGSVPVTCYAPQSFPPLTLACYSSTLISHLKCLCPLLMSSDCLHCLHNLSKKDAAQSEAYQAQVLPNWWHPVGKESLQGTHTGDGLQWAAYCEQLICTMQRQSVPNGHTLLWSLITFIFALCNSVQSLDINIYTVCWCWLNRLLTLTLHFSCVSLCLRLYFGINCAVDLNVSPVDTAYHSKSNNSIQHQNNRQTIDTAYGADGANNTVSLSLSSTFTGHCLILVLLFLIFLNSCLFVFIRLAPEWPSKWALLSTLWHHGH